MFTEIIKNNPSYNPIEIVVTKIMHILNQDDIVIVKSNILNTKHVCDEFFEKIMRDPITNGQEIEYLKQMILFRVRMTTNPNADYSGKYSVIFDEILKKFENKHNPIKIISLHDIAVIVPFYNDKGLITKGNNVYMKTNGKLITIDIEMALSWFHQSLKQLVGEGYVITD